MARRGPSEWFLLSEAFAPSTRSKYERGVADFLSWCAASRESATTPAELDLLLTDFTHFLYDSGGSKDTAKCAYYGILMYLPQLQHQLPTAALARRGWFRKHPPTPYPPLSWHLTVALASWLHTNVAAPLAIGVLLAFDCYLRLGELLNLRKEDVSVPGDVRLERGYPDMALALRHTKTGPNKSVVVADPALRALVLQLVAATGDGQLLFPYSPSYFRSVFRAGAAALGLSPLYVPHSLRHGGATRDHMRGYPLEDILARGRWASTQSARRYVQAGRALLLAMRTPPAVAALGAVVSEALLLAFSLPQWH